MQIKLHHQVFLRTVLTLLLLLALSGAVFAASEKTDAASVYCFGSDDFVQTDSGELSGILVRSVPAAEVADICLGSRVICPGDVLSAGELDALTLVPRCQNDCEAVMTYLPISGSRIGGERLAQRQPPFRESRHPRSTGPAAGNLPESAQ